MTPSPQAGTPAGDVVLAIQRLARTSGADVQELMIWAGQVSPLSSWLASARAAMTRLTPMP